MVLEAIWIGLRDETICSRQREGPNLRENHRVEFRAAAEISKASELDAYFKQHPVLPNLFSDEGNTFGLCNKKSGKV